MGILKNWTAATASPPFAKPNLKFGDVSNEDFNKTI
jgi:hypothetical protein